MKRFVLVLLAISLLFVVACKAKPEPAESPAEAEKLERHSQSLETKEPVATKEAAKSGDPKPLFGERRVIATMINNHPNAQPQTGWSHAKLAYEVLVEGSLTRILLVSDAEEGVLGPIRSARPAFFELAAEWRSIYSHVGNFEYLLESPMVNFVYDWDEFSHGGYYRTQHRYAPHNLYGTMEAIYTGASGIDLAAPEEAKKHFQVYPEAKAYKDGTPASSISFTYDGAQQLEYRYDPESKTYTKSINGVQVIDETSGERLEIANFIILERPHGKMPNGIHEYVDYLTPGTARLFIQGQEFELDYTKAAGEEPMKFSLDGKELILNPGFTYINVVPTGMPITVTP